MLFLKFKTASDFGTPEQSSKFRLELEHEINKKFALLSPKNVEARQAKDVSYT